MAVLLRSARIEEVDAVVALWRDAGAEPTTTDDANSVAVLLRANPDGLIVADDEGRLVGAVIVDGDGWRGGLYRLAVVAGHRRQGIGRALVDEAVRRLRAAGAARCAAIVVADDHRAVAFWTSLGWHRQEARARFVVNP